MKLPVCIVSLCFISSTVTAQDTTGYYASFSGTIDKAAITMNLHKAGKDYSGYYYYDSAQQPIYFSGHETETDSGTNIIEVEGFPEAQPSEIFDFKITDSAITGVWKNSQTGNPLNFTAKVKTTGNYDYFYTKGRQRLFSALRDGPKAEFAASSIWPKGNSESDNYLKEILLDEIKADSTDEVIAPVLVRHKKEFFAKYREQFKTAEPEHVTDIEYQFSKDEMTDLLICWQSSRVLSLAAHHYSYDGGAHGSSSKIYRNYDLQARKLVTIDDIFLDGYDSVLTKLITQKVRTMYKLKENESLKKVEFFEDTLKPSDNFYFTTKGLGFSYLPNQAAPYTMGQITVFIPFKEINKVLEQSFVARLNR
ncbi:MAG: DUF3298 domain-containing protein [Chitinophagaceae bacterium]|nr:DUF3298 domain-containing protein [Chitinophagaceae bacterium]